MVREPHSWHFGLLGPLLVTRDGEEVAIEGRRPRIVLARLLLNPSCEVPQSSLIQALYGEDAPDSAANQVHRGVSALRARGIDIETRRSGYVLHAAAGIDTLEFEGLLAEAHAAVQEERLADAAKGFRRAVALWRGPLLTGVDIELAEAARTYWEELRLTSLEELMDVELALGGHRAIIPELRALADQHPLHEKFHEQLMLAYYRSGRASDALQTYQSLRLRLKSTLGTVPSDALSGLHQRILLQDRAFDLTLAARRVPRQLPAALLNTVGHRDEVEQVRRAFAAGNRIIMITGPSGIGKTTVATEAGHLVQEQFPAGQLFADLKGRRGQPVLPVEMLAEFLRDLGVDPGDIAVGLERRAAQFAALLAERRVLIVLDNASSAEQIQPLLPFGTGSGAIVTARSPLTGLPRARHIALAPLTPVAAHAILAHGAGAERLAREPAATRRLISICGGLPLALRIVTARLIARPHWRLDRMVQVLESDNLLKELESGDLRIRAALDCAYRDLEADSRLLLRRIGALGDGQVHPWIAAALADAPLGHTADLLEELVEANLLRRCGAGFACPDLVLAYARERAEAEESDEQLSAALERAMSARPLPCKAAGEWAPPATETFRDMDGALTA
ncbi:NB-ARC domain-containing protein [Nonomuraea sp. NBC_00507]|uniref:AfsR/SARP family transcriptional regulator n=1 Tax=Nonomuraea sp. NBC_00507 TaxID=2976002 RepID=UPI002E1760C7